jgi:O-succinylbenzoic acid--CoA ligase
MDSTPEWLRHRARLSPERPALLCAADRWTFAELDSRVSAAARALAAAGVRAGDRVALLARNGSAFVVIAHALPRLGAAVVPLHVRWTADELATALRDCAPSLLLYDDANATAATSVAALLPDLRCLPITRLSQGGDSQSDKDPEPGLDRIDLAAVHSILYTSGTTGRPKGTVLTFGNHLWSAVGSALRLGLLDDDRWLACLPLFHVGGLAVLVRSVVCGIPVVLHERFDAAAVNAAIDEYRITIISVVSSMLLQLLEARGARPYPPSLRCVLVGGGPVPRPLLERCAERAVPVVQTYGLTEAASQVTTLAPADALRRLGSAGKPLFPTEVRIAGKGGNRLPPDEPGEILVRGPTVSPGYLNRAQETAAALRDGWLHTGDIGYVDDEGYLYPRGRQDDLIVSGGENIYPAEVEDVLRTHPAVKDVGVTGVPDARWGQRVVAMVRLRKGVAADEAELLAFCRRRLAAYKVPKQLRFAERLPRNDAGKLCRGALQEAMDLADKEEAKG